MMKNVVDVTLSSSFFLPSFELEDIVWASLSFRPKTIVSKMLELRILDTCPISAVHGNLI